MAFSQRMGSTRPKAAPGEARLAAVDQGEESDEVQEASPPQRSEAEQRRDREQEELARRRQAAFEARRKAEEDDLRRREFEAEKARQATIARSRAEAARRATGTSGDAAASGGYGNRRTGTAFAWKKNAQGKPAAPAERRDQRRAGMPSRDECELGISAMISRTSGGMKEGLTALGLPSFPLVFVPGEELKLCGHDVREEINEMIHMWMTDEQDDFYECLAAIAEQVKNPLLTAEEVEMMDSRDQWVPFKTADGRQMYRLRGSDAPPAGDDDDDEDEVIDVTPSGERLPTAPSAVAGAAAAAASAVQAPVQDYYALLGVEPSASLQEIRTKFRALVVTEHPEKGGDVQKFQELNKAYSILSDRGKRQEFDALRTSSRTAGGGDPRPAGAAEVD